MITDTIRRAQEGDEAAFAELYNRHYARVRNICFKISHDPNSADDLAQECFLQIYLQLKSFRGDANFTTWLHRVAVNMVLMSLRKRRLQTFPLDSDIMGDDLIGEHACLGRRDPQLETALDRLTMQRLAATLAPRQRTVFELRAEGFEHHEIARIMNCSIGNSKSQYFKAMQKVRRGLLQSRFAAR